MRTRHRVASAAPRRVAVDDATLLRLKWRSGRLARARPEDWVHEEDPDSGALTSAAYALDPMVSAAVRAAFDAQWAARCQPPSFYALDLCGDCGQLRECSSGAPASPTVVQTLPPYCDACALVRLRRGWPERMYPQPRRRRDLGRGMLWWGRWLDRLEG